MFILDSLMISGIRWALQTVATAAEAEMNDDGALRQQLLEAGMRREMGELSDDEFRRTEASLLARIREIRERREGGAGPLAFTSPTADDATAERVQVEATVTGDFYPPSAFAASAFASSPLPPALKLRRTRRRDRPVGPVAPAAPPRPDRARGPAGRAKRTSARQAPSAGRAGKRRT